jgi:hypothetical protein
VGQRRLTEPAIPPACPEGDGLGLEDHDAQRWLGFGQGEGRPQPRETGTDHDHVRDGILAEGRFRRRRLIAQPIADRSDSEGLDGDAAHAGMVTWRTSAFPAPTRAFSHVIRVTDRGMGR